MSCSTILFVRRANPDIDPAPYCIRSSRSVYVYVSTVHPLHFATQME